MVDYVVSKTHRRNHRGGTEECAHHQGTRGSPIMFRPMELLPIAGVVLNTGRELEEMPKVENVYAQPAAGVGMSGHAGGGDLAPEAGGITEYQTDRNEQQNKGEERVAPILLNLFPSLVYGGEARLLSKEKGAKIESKASLLAPLDYYASMQSEIFISASPRIRHNALVRLSARSICF
ncbi:hypothetical protein GIB67_033469 [Kingdonia uniflora]|uniref:Uncharacterized protein n=1 Tax=Kingdonia uniflora TaxID=39325 RepID=A0A7J7MDS9_9MAGN|nr:hypothetical protein GIB67_033469 [Kingdonia uniflora]